MEQTMPNLARAITNVQNSRRFGLLCEAIIRSVPKNEITIANTGLIDTVASMTYKSSAMTRVLVKSEGKRSTLITMD